jgi:hypothetical protein
VLAKGEGAADLQVAGPDWTGKRAPIAWTTTEYGE